MFAYVFLLGRPGCGKSVAYRILVGRIREEGLAEEFRRVDDYPILKEMVEQDIDFKKHIPSEGEFQITDRSIYDDVLKEVSHRLKGLRKPGRMIFVEFARNNYTDALRNFDREILDRSLIVYLYCPFEVCCERNVRRFEETGPKGLDEHIVPRDQMEKYYRHEDYEELYLRSEDELRKRAPAPIVVVGNDVESLERLRQELEKVITALKATRSKKKS